MDKIQRQREHFNSVADRYHEARRHENHLRLKTKIWSNFLSGHRDLLRDNLNVLEAMCGFADGKAILEENLGIKVNYSGFDYSDTVLEQLKKEQPDLNVFHADAGSVQLDDQYDVIMILGGLHHVPDIAGKVVSTLAKAIRPGGYFINLEPTSGNPVFSWIRQKIYDRNSLFDEETERAFEVNELYSLFTNAGLRQKDVMFPGLLSYVLYYNPDAFPFLNIGGKRMVDSTFNIDRPFLRSQLGRMFSFATLSMWQK